MAWRSSIPAHWLIAWMLLAVAGDALIVRNDIAQRREAFQADARLAHRLLSQRAAQHDAILATLDLLGAPPAGADRPEARLPALYPQVVAVLRRDADAPWPDAALQAAESRSRTSRGAVLAAIDASAAQFTLLRAGTPSSFALRIDLARMVPWDSWPLARDGPVAVSLVHAGVALPLQAGAAPSARPAGLTEGFVFAKPLDTPSHPFELRLQRATGPAEWPWPLLIGWAAGSALALGWAATLLARRRERQRAAALQRVARVAQLNALGELAGGLAHELNQPLTAVLTSAQAARRLLDEDPPELGAARDAAALASAQARRAADVLAQLRRRVEAPAAASAMVEVPLGTAVRQVMAMLDPELQQRGIAVRWEAGAGENGGSPEGKAPGNGPVVRADPVALEQIVHNLVGNAMQALAEVPAGERVLRLRLGRDGDEGVLAVIDSGPGIAPEAFPHLFEPFFTTRPGGLGLGLSLCETLAQSMHGSLRAVPGATRGAEFRLALPLATDTGAED